MDLTPENKEEIDKKSVYQLLHGNRFSPIGDPWLQGETGIYWLNRLSKVRDEDNRAYVRASKDMGWR